VFGAKKYIVIARELTKRFETVIAGNAEDVLERMRADEDQTRGEFVVMLSGAEPVSESEAQVQPMLRVLLSDLPIKQAASMVAKITGLRKNDVYQMALELKKELDD